ncbi:murein L,D-transpeptidase catalytic domain family protein [Pseudomonas sp. PS1]|uniref:Murein L,D-transpeptidase catalytic domain family protein n=1 Tax=Stutzerimonas marianensis TaxID=2929513 RepID=A0A9X2AQD6_9GAMM|nr:murein L,D-transpeptidase catalytic domain family protein [Pseudomonas marianensis]MCJ0972213.1 murein L,D-transpeptidase catalytic domain family protein [Pseudomonas marianensis]
MMVTLRRLCLVAGMLLSAPLLAASPPYQPLVDDLARVAPSLDRRVLTHAVAAMQCAVNNGATPAQRLAVIDFSLPSSERRLWIFDLHRGRLLLEEFVAHGMKSGENLATRFSNVVGSHQSSIGLFRTAESYSGKHGYSLRMDGLEPGVNDRARERAIVIHPAAYVNPAWIATQGRIGRSQGCPAVRPEVARMVVDSLKGGQFMFSWYPDQQWLQSSAYLNCEPNQVASILAARSGG